MDRFILGFPRHLSLHVARNADCDDLDMGSQGKAALQQHAREPLNPVSLNSSLHIFCPVGPSYAYF